MAKLTHHVTGKQCIPIISTHFTVNLENAVIFWYAANFCHSSLYNLQVHQTALQLTQQLAVRLWLSQYRKHKWHGYWSGIVLKFFPAMSQCVLYCTIPHCKSLHHLTWPHSFLTLCTTSLSSPATWQDAMSHVTSTLYKQNLTQLVQQVSWAECTIHTLLLWYKA